MAQSYPPCAWAQSEESVFVVVRVPVEEDSVRIGFSSSGFTFSASSVPAFSMQLSSIITPERSSFCVAALGHVEITLRTSKRRATGPFSTRLKPKYLQVSAKRLALTYVLNDNLLCVCDVILCHVWRNAVTVVVAVM
jgi:hypothetical protein